MDLCDEIEWARRWVDVPNRSREGGYEESDGSEGEETRFWCCVRAHIRALAQAVLLYTDLKRALTLSIRIEDAPKEPKHEEDDSRNHVEPHTLGLRSMLG